MNLWWKCGTLLAVFVLALAVAGCGHDTYYTAVEEDKWHTITITSSQEEGEKKLLIELPGELEQCGAFEDEATVKRLQRRGGEVWLLPENPDYQPIDGRNATILGKVSAVIRTY